MSNEYDLVTSLQIPDLGPSLILVHQSDNHFVPPDLVGEDVIGS